jgi:deoxycytidine triphosphate deaminase
MEVNQMASIVIEEKLKEAIKQQTFIKGGNPECAEGVKYDFRLSSRILKASYERPIDANQLSETEKGNLFIEPGEMVFVLTEERLDLPNNMLAQLSPKRKLSHAGILAIGGFCVDPLYEGRLLIGLFNLSSTRFPLIPGKKVIAAIFLTLEKSEVSDFQKPEAALEDFPDELIQVMQKYRPLIMNSVLESVQRLQNQMDALRRQIDSQNEWYNRFEGILERHSGQIGDLIQGLAIEIKAREKGEDSLSRAIADYTAQMKSIEKGMNWLKGAAWVISGLLALIGIPIIVAWILKMLKLT